MATKQQSGDSDGSREFILIYDARFERAAKRLARTCFLDALAVSDGHDGDLGHRANIIVYADLQDLSVARRLRDRVGYRPPAERSWAFVVPSGPDRRASTIQAMALGATVYLTEADSPFQVRRLLSIAQRASLAPSRVARLKQVRGGETILEAGVGLGELFNGVSSGAPVAVEKIAALGMDLTRSIGSIGAGSWLSTVRSYHEGTFQHCLLVTGVTAGYVNQHISDPADALRLTTAALLHDIGKAAVPLHILDKPGPLTESEFAAIKAHPVIGHDYLAKQPGMDPLVLAAVRHHHEALDGSGYPDGLTAAQIGELTRIVTVCDIFAALAEARAYKPPTAPQEAISMLVKLALEGKVDYPAVRNLAQVFDMDPPESLDEVKWNLAHNAGQAREGN